MYFFAVYNLLYLWRCYCFVTSFRCVAQFNFFLKCQTIMLLLRYEAIMNFFIVCFTSNVYPSNYYLGGHDWGMSIRLHKLVVIKTSNPFFCLMMHMNIFRVSV